VSSHSDLGPELRQLAEAILDRLDPKVRAAAKMAGESLRGPGRCQQVWCPVCALAALISGEQHPMLSAIGEHSVALMALVRAVVAEQPSHPAPASHPEPAWHPESPQAGAEGGATDSEAPPSDSGKAAPPTGDTRYHRIDIVVEPPEGEPGSGRQGPAPEDWP